LCCGSLDARATADVDAWRSGITCNATFVETAE
jgi:hypothetical protein